MVEGSNPSWLTTFFSARRKNGFRFKVSGFRSDHLVAYAWELETRNVKLETLFSVPIV
jgi:hypothetical protein